MPKVPSRESTNWSDFGDDADGNQSLKQLQKMYPPDLDEISTCSEVMEQWPGCGTENNDDTNRRIWQGGHPVRPGKGPLSETASQCSNASGNSSTRRKSSFFSRSTKAEVADKVGKKSQRVSASVWLAKDFPIPIQQFMPILEALSLEHEAMRRLKDLLNSDSLKNAAERTGVAASAAAEASGSTSRSGHVFPIKVQVPLNLAVRGMVHFEAFELKTTGSLSADLFKVPDGYTFTARRDAQKTVSRARKRMMIAQLAM